MYAFRQKRSLPKVNEGHNGKLRHESAYTLAQWTVHVIFPPDNHDSTSGIGRRSTAIVGDFVTFGLWNSLEFANLLKKISNSFGDFGAVGPFDSSFWCSSATNECCDWLMPNCMNSRELGTVDPRWLLIAHLHLAKMQYFDVSKFKSVKNKHSFHV